MPISLIYHNPKCSKSRKALEILENENIDLKVINYLNGELTKEMLLEILKLSSLTIRDIIRKDDETYKINNLDNNRLSQDELINYVVKFPKLLQRPIIVHNGTAIIARPPEKILEFI